MTKTSTRALTLFALTAVLSSCDTSTLPADEVPTAGSLEGLASEALAADLSYLRQEEKLARDVYRSLGSLYPTAAFGNIASSEQTHTDRVHALLEALVLPDPVQEDEEGVFAEPALAKLYTDLVFAGRVSEIEGLRVGATIEDLDIADLRAMAARAELPEALAVYRSLECGSRNHLRSFLRVLEAAGGSWTPTFLSQAEVDAIATSAREACGP